MPSRPFSRKVVVLVLFAILALPLASAAEPRQEASVSSLFERLWSFLTSAWSESGCHIDPNGNCAPEPLPTDDIDEGCRIDPDGRCSA
jgi:hypothetical protein